MDGWSRAKRSSVSSERPFIQQAQNRPVHQPSLGTMPERDPQFTPSYGSLYDSRYPVYGLDWCYRNGQTRLAVSSYKEDAKNRLKIVQGNAVSGGWKLQEVAGATVRYPTTRVQWDPAGGNRFAATSDCLRIYEETVEDGDPVLLEKLCLTNAKTKNPNQLPPMTSFDWNRADPNLIITCSIDTTCTLWDVSRSSNFAKTQLIAHDSEVYDVKFTAHDRNVFCSCSSDGSVRVFDFRNLEHSTIIYEPQATLGEHSQLVRLAPSNYNSHHLAVIEENSPKVLLLDLRYPGMPMRVLHEHSATVNALAWHPNKNVLLTGGDDCLALITDLSIIETERPFTHGGQHRTVGSVKPTAAFTAASEIYNLCWDPTGEWVGYTAGKRVQLVRAAAAHI